MASWRDSHLVLAASGGPDSVALLRAVLSLKQLTGGPGRLFVAHLHHGLRAAAADEDQEWLEALCRRRNVPIEIGRFDIAAAAAEQGDGLEAAARQARYEFLRSVAERLGARWVAVGHTADDQVETVLHRILRGTGLAGLAGMPRARPLSPSVTLIRPLLDVRRRDVLKYLERIGQDYRTDASNTESCFTRNRLRNELLPTIRAQFNSDVDQAVLRLAAQSRDAQQLIADLAANLCSCCVAFNSGPSNSTVTLDCEPLAGNSPLIVGEVCRSAWKLAGWPLQAMGFQEWQQLAAMVRGDEGMSPINLPGNVYARRESDSLILERRLPAAN